MTLSIADVTSTFQVISVPNTVTIAVALAVVVMGVGRSFAPVNVALKTSSPAGMPVVLLSLHPTPTSATVANIVNARVARITILLSGLQVEPHEASETDSALLSGDFSVIGR